MSRIETILIIVLVIILLAYLSFVAYIVYQIRKDNKKPASAATPVSDSKIDLSSPWQTDFFNQSIDYAKKVLFGKEFIKEYGQQGYFGNKLMDVINMLNEETKNSVIIAIKSSCLEPGSCRENERIMRYMAEQEQVPLWFFILREGAKKVVPGMFSEESDQNMQSDSKIVPLYQKTG